MMTGLLIAVAALWGAATGMLVPRAAYRFSVPEEENWRERCPVGHPLRGPARGWIGRARCGQCRTGDAYGPGTPNGGSGPRRSKGSSGPRTPNGGSGPRRSKGSSGPRTSNGSFVRRPAVGSSGSGTPTGTYGPSTPLLSLVTALLCAGLAAASGTRPEVAVWLLLAPVGVLLAVVDFRVRRLPDVLTLPLATAALLLLGLVTLVPEHTGHWPSAALGALALGAGYYVLWFVNPGGMGFGDVKLALGTGAVLGWYGWGTVLLGTFAGFLFGALYGGALVVAGRAGRKTAVPFGPFLIAGAYLGLLIGAYTA
ncbi:prepilin peptidase [Streptomyces sp. NPDC050287]|uniref:prepilin peptidase n=1 Tax=Streptomyces sp. NPDC050287 TaxID=3365608 RepID=UPI0037A4DE54